ncbi:MULTISPECIES: AtpZ/AtpI family protein [Pseudovibrio]|uniref:AtpZ/AtpI family protein n=1 Tax=Stappiaceae TaxID=2821832 RepID=UPI0023667C4A|nr:MULTISPECIES: AtpZ/AtpI family protein [Pseudovibrio]MDD7911258.1 AtpZ/AtpI family protein [Pseudovibrio exalbescens]MDX5593055.1 AtpZ/AtpI family protein [Pseudovibrio sp. SPO723]
MASDDPEQTKKNPAASDSHLTERLEQLGKTLEQHQETETSKDAKAQDTSGALSGVTQALKLSSEFVAGVLVGAGIGWMADTWLGTKPWGLIVFLMLGFGAGILNLLRALGRVAEPERRMNSHKKQD